MPAIQTTDLRKSIQFSMEKIGASKPAELCRYLPGQNGGHMHHLTFHRLTKQDPNKLVAMIEDHVLNTHSPKKFPPLPRASKGTPNRKGKRTIQLSDAELADLLDSLKEAGANDLAKRLREQTQTLSQLKRELISSIRQNKPSEDLWRSFCERAETLKNEAV